MSDRAVNTTPLVAVWAVVPTEIVQLPSFLIISSRIREKMNRKILVVAVSLLLVAMFVTPTMAMNPNPKNPKKIRVGFDRTGFGATPPDSWITKGETFHGRGSISVWGEGAYNIYDVDETGAFLKDKVVIEGGDYIMIGKVNINLKNPGTETVVQLGPFTIPVTVGTGSSILKVTIDFGEENMFKGIMKSQGELMLFPTGGAGCYTGLQKSVLHGTGEYQGWTLIWKREYFEGAVLRWDAYMLIP